MTPNFAWPEETRVVSGCRAASGEVRFTSALSLKREAEARDPAQENAAGRPGWHSHDQRRDGVVELHNLPSRFLDGSVDDRQGPPFLKIGGSLEFLN
ncbi:MAG: hypothetical protein IV085_09210 [Thiobacillus sp.]|nr:hypothetical protein [Thiobacillus sp.]